MIIEWQPALAAATRITLALGGEGEQRLVLEGAQAVSLNDVDTPDGFAAAWASVLALPGVDLDAARSVMEGRMLGPVTVWLRDRPPGAA